MRLDRWLWAARFYKTRALAVEAIDGGKVDVNGERAKRARPVRVGDAICLRLPPYEHRLEVRALSERRGPAPEAAALYRETPDSMEARARLRAQLAAQPSPPPGLKGRPTKKARRLLDKWRRP